mmetsp:Transcript_5951/g.9940  ORF Transcript_5951/g.9940 Transcript_5951/m.9940 type:complete len:217 (-) Transcript_5951:171-821(-)
MGVLTILAIKRRRFRCFRPGMIRLKFLQSFASRFYFGCLLGFFLFCPFCLLSLNLSLIKSSCCCCCCRCCRRRLLGYFLQLLGLGSLNLRLLMSCHYCRLHLGFFILRCFLGFCSRNLRLLTSRRRFLCFSLYCLLGLCSLLLRLLPSRCRFFGFLLGFLLSLCSLNLRMLTSRCLLLYFFLLCCFLCLCSFNLCLLTCCCCHLGFLSIFLIRFCH